MKRILAIILIFALVVPAGCAQKAPEPGIGMASRPGTELTVPTAPTVEAETGPAPTGADPEQPTVPVSEPVTTDPELPEPTGAAKPTDPVPTEAPSPTDPAPKPIEAPPAPTEVQQPKPTEPKPPKPTEPKPTQPPQPKPTEPSHRHSYTARVVAPTCTEQGYTLHKCACGASYTDSYTNATGHGYDGGRVTTAATCTAEGVKTYTCTKCGSTKTEAIAKTAHSYVETVVAPTYSAGGYTLHTCSVCGHSYTDCETDQLVFDIEYWVQYTKDLAREMGFIVSDDGEDGYWGGWDNPIDARPHSADNGILERRIKQAMNFYKNQGVKYIWVWAKPCDDQGGYDLYIGYA